MSYVQFWNLDITAAITYADDRVASALTETVPAIRDGAVTTFRT